MSSSEKWNQPPDGALTSDTDVCRYLRNHMHAGDMSFNHSPVLDYMDQRDFAVEPLEPETAAYLVNLFAQDSSAEHVSEYRISCYTPMRSEPVRGLIERLESWGYEIVGLRRTNRSTMGVPHVAIVAEQSPDPVQQIAALSPVDADAAALLDGWVLAVYNRHLDDEAALTPAEWASIRGVSEEVVQENVSTLGEELREKDGISGTQWGLEATGGIRL